MEKHGKTLDDDEDSLIAATQDGFNNVFYQDDRMDQMMEDSEMLMVDNQNDNLLNQHDMEDEIAIVQ